jgi:hypothetical protein
MLNVFKKFSSTDSLRMSGNGEMQDSLGVEKDGLIKLISGTGNGDGHGEFSVEDGMLIL